MATSDFAQVVGQSHRALGEFVRGDPEPLRTMYSRRVANPFGGVARGWKQVAETMQRAAALYRDGEVVGFETMAQDATGDLGYLVEVERCRARVAGGEQLAAVTIRVTTVLRREDAMHRHADPLSAPQPAESVVHR